MRIIITGAKGQLGQDVLSLFEHNGYYDVLPFSKEELDITDAKAVLNKIQELKPDWILHCAAYTDVEAAEDEGKSLNWLINRDGSKYISQAAASIGAKLIYISTDYVFDGKKGGPYKEEDQTHPLNQYGAAKLAGEEAIHKHLPGAHIIRTSWVFGENGKNFVYTMLRLAERLETLTVVNDQHGRPTYTKDLAAFMRYIIEHKVPGGIYHFSNDSEATWFEFAKAILKDKAIHIQPVDSTAFVQKAKRPKYTVMSLEKVKKTGFHIPTWQNALDRFMNTVFKN
ncbi:NAD(P)-dependent oxidoreductase [Pullulanibacillus camelliae]|uniref:dTDP-4-dehydrorhamnose reductase n=1 Tax=Pullulanibacillus camelliae TaxID=1707096 RepID=A0A8J2YNY2_9BACL|nr:dTDP-4-dehydrorhamnose reductase [Pullulanibacillus camelliae]GGE56105.1 NAD(P)-dependent oxidoreductase [Pullulanibacillus camelliae]